MNEMNFSTSACRYCRFYEHQGRRGGSCQMLGVPVQSSWKACAFASPPFDTTLKKLEDIFQLETSIPLDPAPKLFSNSSGITIKESNPQMTSSQSE